MHKKVAIVFLVHFFDTEIEKRFRKLTEECGEFFDVFLLAEAGVTVPKALVAETHFFDFDTLRPMARSIIGEKVVPGNCHLRSLHFFRRFPGYRFYWFVEYDVLYSGNWRTFFTSFRDDASDLLAAHVRLSRDDPRWRWASTFSPGADRPTDEERLIGFFPIHRISARGLETVERRVEAGWVGHFETVVPSALAFEGLIVADLGGCGAFTPAGRIERNYLVPLPNLYHYMGTLRWAPPIALMPIKNLLYHPCKTKSQPTRPRDRRRHLRRAKVALINGRAIFRYALGLLWLTMRSRLPNGNIGR